MFLTLILTYTFKLEKNGFQLAELPSRLINIAVAFGETSEWLKRKYFLLSILISPLNSVLTLSKL